LGDDTFQSRAIACIHPIAASITESTYLALRNEQTAHVPTADGQLRWLLCRQRTIWRSATTTADLPARLNLPKWQHRYVATVGERQQFPPTTVKRKLGRQIE